MTINDFFRLLSPLALRTRNMIRHAVIKAIDDTTKWQRAQIEALDSEVRNGIPVFQPYGFASNPDASDGDSPEALVVNIGGRPDGAVIVQITDRRYRARNLQPGEVAMYDKTGSIFTFQTNGDVVLSTGSGEFKINDNVTITGDLRVNGGIKADADVVGHSGTLGADISLINHGHNVSALDGNSLPVVFTPPGKTGSPT